MVFEHLVDHDKGAIDIKTAHEADRVFDFKGVVEILNDVTGLEDEFVLSEVLEKGFDFFEGGTGLSFSGNMLNEVWN